MPTNVVLLGSSTFAIPTAEMLLRSREYALKATITRPDEPAGRGLPVAPPPLADWSRANKIALNQPKTRSELTATIRSIAPEVAIVAAYGKIIPQEALAMPRFGFVNIHPSLLPRYRGASPIQAAIANGDEKTGVTIMLLDEQLDHGPIIAQKGVPLSPTETHIELERKLAKHGAELLKQNLPDYLSGKLTPVPQEHNLATTTPLLTREHGRIDWRESAVTIERKIRAYEGWPGTWCLLPDGSRLKILRASIGGPANRKPGEMTGNGQLQVVCGNDTSLILEEVQREGGRPQSSIAFFRGYRGGTTLPIQIDL
ncbi:MAG: methionyl-tRNA formyltransferase [Candidatus Uhrbacteria bacterium]